MTPLSSLLFLLWKEPLSSLTFPRPQICITAIDFHVRRDHRRAEPGCPRGGVPERGLTNSIWSWAQHSYLPLLGLKPSGTAGPHVTGTNAVLPCLRAQLVTPHQSWCDGDVFHESSPRAQAQSFCSFLPQAHPLRESRSVSFERISLDLQL